MKKEQCDHVDHEKWHMIGSFHERGVARLFCEDCLDEFNTSFEYYKPYFTSSKDKEW